MAGMVEICKATVTIIPNMQGSQKTITEELTGAAGTAGEKAGAAAGTNMAKSLGKAAIGTAVAAKVGKEIADSWKEVDTAMDTVVAKTGATGETLEGLGDSMRNVATSIPTDFQTAGEAIGEVNTKFQLTGTELETLSGQFIKFSQLNNTDVSDSVDNVANTLAAFGQSGEDAASLLDAMNAAGQATGIGMDELGASLQKNAATFTSLGMTAQDATGLLATFNAAGVTTADTSTALRTAMKNAAQDGMSLSEAVGKFGEMMNSSASDTDKLNAAIDLFGARAGTAIYNAFQNGTISAETFSTAMTGVGDSVSSTFEATLDPTDRFQQAMNGLKSVGAELVQALTPALTSIANVAVPAIQKLAEVFGNLPEGVKTAIVVLGGLVAVAGPLASLGSGISSVFGGLGGIFGKLAGTAGSAAGGLASIGGSAASAAGGAASAATGFGAMAGAALQIVAIGASFAMVGAGLKLIADGAVEIGKGGLPAAAALLEMVAALTAFMGVASLLGPSLTAGAVGIGVFGAAVLGIGAGVGAAAAGISLLVDAFGNLITKTAESSEGLNSVLQTLGTEMVATITATFEGLTATITASFDGVASTITAVFDGISASASAAFEGIASTITAVFDGITNTITAVLDGIAKVIKTIGDSAVKAGEGFKTFAEGIKMIVDTNILDLGASLGAVATGMAAIISSSSGVDKIGPSIKEIAEGAKAAESAVNSLSQAMSGVMSKVANQIQTTLTNLKQAVHSSITDLQNAFASAKFEFGHIDLPHFSMKGKFDAKKGTVPKVDVEWYAAAAEQGAIFSSPRLIGVGDASQPEMLVGEQTLYEKIAKAVGQNGGGDVAVYIGEQQLDAIIQRSDRRTAIRSGGH